MVWTVDGLLADGSQVALLVLVVAVVVVLVVIDDAQLIKFMRLDKRDGSKGRCKRKEKPL